MRCCAAAGNTNNVRMKKLLSFVLIVFFIAAGCTSLPDAGGRVTLKEQGMAAVSEADYQEMNSKGSAEDLAGLQQMVQSGKVVVLPADMQGTLVDKGFDRAQIEVEINGKMQKVWVARDILR